MSRINTNINSMIAQNTLMQQQNQLSKSLERLSTGLAINSGADNPAGLIASQNLQSQEASLNAAIGNAQRAEQISNIAEGGLQEIQSQLLQLQSLVGQTANTAGLSDAEKAANQQQVDAILQTIDRISSTTSFAGTKLLNGTYDFTTSNVGSSVADYQINAAKIPFNGNVDVKAVITASAQHAGMYLSMGGALDLTNASSTFVFDLGGAGGSHQFSFGSGTAMADIATAVNSYKSVTGVSAVASGTGLVLKSTAYGSNQFVSFTVDSLGGQSKGDGVHLLSSTNEDQASTVAANTTAWASVNNIRDAGQDVGAIINGIKASGSGTTASVSNDSLDMSVTFTNTGAQTTGGVSLFKITGGGATFSMGPSIDILNQVSLGIKNVATRNLGNSTDGWLSDLASGGSTNLITGNMNSAQTIVNNAINQISTLRGRLGSFQSNIADSTINALNVNLQNTTAAESQITDTNFASETANMTRDQILVQAATSVLSTANTMPQYVLKLLG